jgi:hypothetical protein
MKFTRKIGVLLLSLMFFAKNLYCIELISDTSTNNPHTDGSKDVITLDCCAESCVACVGECCSCWIPSCVYQIFWGNSSSSRSADFVTKTILGLHTVALTGGTIVAAIFGSLPAAVGLGGAALLTGGFLGYKVKKYGYSSAQRGEAFDKGLCC